MKKGTGGGVWLRFAVLVAMALGAGPAAGQSARERSECRCVDPDGSEIEDCTCFRVPRFEGLAVLTGRPRLGISVDAGQGAGDDAVGARVADVLENGPADDAGLRRGDLVTHLGARSLLQTIPDEDARGFDLDESMPVQRLLALARDLEPGDAVEVRYRRGDESRTATLEAEELDDWGGSFSFVAPEWDAQAFEESMRGLSDRMREMRWRFDADGPPGAPPARDFGIGPDQEVQMRFLDRFGGMRGREIDLAELNPELGVYFGATEGLLVLDVEDDSQLGLVPGDVVLDVGGREIGTPGDFWRVLESYGPDESVTFRVRRDGRDMNVSGRRGG